MTSSPTSKDKKILNFSTDGYLGPRADVIIFYRSIAVYYYEIKHFNWLKLVT